MSRAAPRPKRAGEDFARYGGPSSRDDDGSGPSSAKKPRFDARNPSTLAPDAPEEDTVLDLDEIGKGGQQTKRSAVNLDGYDSDSSTENFDARAAARARQKEREAQGGTSKDEEDNDMFADLEEEEFPDGDEDEEAAQGARDGKKKAVRFLEANEIEGQVASSKSGGHVSADFGLNNGGGTGKGKAAAAGREHDSSSESGSDEERDRVGSDVDEELGAGSKKRHAPKLDAFNMRQEGEEGRFDESGNFVRKAADPDAVHDSWLEGTSKRDMKRAAEAHKQREEERRRKDAEQDSVQLSDVLGALILRLERGETPLEALQRLGKGKQQKAKPKWHKNKRKQHANGAGESDTMDVDAQKEPVDAKETERRREVEAITGAADQLLSRGETDVYDTERELLMRQYRNETGEDWKEHRTPADEDEATTDTAQAGGERQWEYRWSDARDGGERHGPYDGPTMRAWNGAGYFGEGVEFRRVGDVEWSRSVDF